MNEYPHIEYALKTIFVVEFGFSEDLAADIYRSTAEQSGYLHELRAELTSAFDDPTISWKRMLLNDLYEVFDADNEEVARAYAKKILWNPIFCH